MKKIKDRNNNSCFVQIRDAKKWNETLFDLYELGVRCQYKTGKPHPIAKDTDVLLVEGQTWIDTYLDSVTILEAIATNKAISCGENITLFLAIVRMRNDTDKGQYFMTTDDRHWINQGMWMPKESIFKCLCDKNQDKNARRATPKEIVKFCKEHPRMFFKWETNVK